ncbi:hypothetical protein Tco_0576079 [Tanacetum coccineum]
MSLNSKEQQMHTNSRQSKKELYGILIYDNFIHTVKLSFTRQILKGTRTESGFKLAIANTLRRQDVETIIGTNIQTTEGKVDTRKVVDASLINTESIGTESKEQDTSSRSWNDAHAE